MKWFQQRMRVSVSLNLGTNRFNLFPTKWRRGTPIPGILLIIRLVVGRWLSKSNVSSLMYAKRGIVITALVLYNISN